MSETMSDWCQQTGKVRYASQSAAIKARDEMLGRKHQKAGKLHAYRCDFCGGAHIGTKQGWRHER